MFQESKSEDKGYVNNEHMCGTPQDIIIYSPQNRDSLLSYEVENCSSESLVVDIDTSQVHNNEGDSLSPSVRSPPPCESLHFANEEICDNLHHETIKTIDCLERELAKRTCEEPTAIRFSNVTVSKIEEPKLRTAKRYINVKCLKDDCNIDIASLYYCKRCHIDLQQEGVFDCRYNNDITNLCTNCYLASGEICPVCYKCFDLDGNG